MKATLSHLVRKFTIISTISGQIVSWLTVSMVIVLTFNILSSWIFNTSSILLSESITWMHSANFLLAAGYTLNRDEHVRVDIFYSRMSLKKQSLVDIFGTLFLLIPVSIFIIWSSWSYVLLSWRVGEVSAEAGGMPATFLLKGLLLLMPLILIIEGINQLLIKIDRINDISRSDNTTEGEH